VVADSHHFGKEQRIRIRIEVKNWIRIRIKVKIQKLFRGSKAVEDRGRPQMEAWGFKMEPWRVCRPVVADCHHFDEKQDPDPHSSEKLDPDPH
jgi:hypothetical protein